MNPLDPSVFKLSLQQEFTMRRIRDEAPQMRQEDLALLLIQATQQMMIKDNVIAHLSRENAQSAKELADAAAKSKSNSGRLDEFNL